MSELNWNDNEAVVRAALRGDVKHMSQPLGLYLITPGLTISRSTREEAYAALRAQHPMVQAFELAHNHAKQPQPSERSTPGERLDAHALREASLQFPCPRCNAEPSKYCTELGAVILPHFARMNAAHNAVRKPDPQPSPVDDQIVKRIDFEKLFVNQWEPKPVDDLGELERPITRPEMFQTGEDDCAASQAEVEDYRKRVEDRIQSLIARVREAEKTVTYLDGLQSKYALQFAHETADRMKWQSMCQDADRKLAAAEQSLQAEREKTAGLEEEIARLRQEKRDA